MFNRIINVLSRDLSLPAGAVGALTLWRYANTRAKHCAGAKDGKLSERCDLLTVFVSGQLSHWHSTLLVSVQLAAPRDAR